MEYFMKKTGLNIQMRLFLYAGALLQSIYIIMTPFDEISSLILIATPLFLLVAYIDLYSRKNIYKHDDTVQWDRKKIMLQNYYSDEQNIDYTFAKCLSDIQQSNQHSVRINRILNNYKETNQKFKIHLKREPENRIDSRYFSEF